MIKIYRYFALFLLFISAVLQADMMKLKTGEVIEIKGYKSQGDQYIVDTKNYGQRTYLKNEIACIYNNPENACTLNSTNSSQERVANK